MKKIKSRICEGLDLRVDNIKAHLWARGPKTIYKCKQPSDTQYRLCIAINGYIDRYHNGRTLEEVYDELRITEEWHDHLVNGDVKAKPRIYLNMILDHGINTLFIYCNSNQLWCDKHSYTPMTAAQ